MIVRRIVQAGMLVCVLSIAPSATADAQQKTLSIDAIFDPATKIDFDGKAPGEIAWLNETQYIVSRDGAGGDVEWMKVDAASGRTDPLFDAARMTAALARLPGIPAEEAAGLAHQSEYTFNSSMTGVVLNVGFDLYYYRFGDENATRLTSSSGEEEEAGFSPDGRMVAFVRDSNLHVVELSTQREHPITNDGDATLLNGKLDWVYSEEVYGRGSYRAYWWSPDSSRLAFLQTSEHAVPEFTVVDHIPYRQTVETWNYPKAGDPNPTVRLGIASAAGGAITWTDTSKYAPIEFLIVAVDWARGGKSVVFQVQDREQTWLELDIADPVGGSTRTMLKETSKAWVNNSESPVWLKDGSFLWLSERSGWKHLYHYKADGTLVRQVTDGRWEARTLHGIDEATGWIYFSGTERSTIGGDLYRIKLDGTGMKRLSEAEGTHKATFNPVFTTYVDSWSNVTTPPQARLHRADGSEVRGIEANPVPVLAEYRLSTPEFLQVKTRDGFVMEAMMIKPPGFDSSRRYPVYQFTYGGPHAPSVHNAWGGSSYMYHQLLAQHGIIVWICDNRTASGKGIESTWPVYKNFGELELRDIEDGLSWLKQQPYVDASRIGLHGWSYGGFMTSYALTHSSSFAMGISGGTVSDWRDYDTIYTERFMGMPQKNADGYRKSSPRFAASQLHGKLLLIHGSIDDNVHMQNTVQFAYELQKAGKPFDLMLYAKSRHAVTDPALIKHLRMTMFNFTLEHLRPEDGKHGATMKD